MGGSGQWPVYMRLKPSVDHETTSFISTVAQDPTSESLSNPTKRPWRTHGTETVITTPPRDGGTTRFTSPESFEFSAVFNETATQRNIYERTLLPLVTNVLQGRDSVFFAIGSSGSGKTHTMLGTSTSSGSTSLPQFSHEPGIVHLAIDAIFKSIEGQMASFEKVEKACDRQWNRDSSGGTLATTFLQEHLSRLPHSEDTSQIIPDIEDSQLNENQKIDMGANSRYQYAIYISMVEIYNEKIYDLFEIAPSSLTVPMQATRSSSSTFSAAPNLPISPSKQSSYHRNMRQRKSISIKSDPDHPGKVCLRDQRKIYVGDREQAYRVIEQGRRNRSAQWTQTNSSSSRSHAFIMIEVKKISKTGRGHVASSQLSVVDLAGTEKNKLAQTRGERFVESNAINKSLMLLGQCLEQQRSNGVASPRRMLTRAGTRLPTVNEPAAKVASSNSNMKNDQVGFRNSVLTRLLLSNAFSPSLRQMTAVMVNIDPYGDYNLALQILRYSALARHVNVKQEPLPEPQETPGDTTLVVRVRQMSPNKTVRKALPRVTRDITPIKALNENRLTASPRETTRIIFSRQPSRNEVSGGVSEQEQVLHDEIAQLKAKCFRIEIDTREELWRQMEERLEDMRQKYDDLVDSGTASEQLLTDKKLELLSRQKEQEITLLQENLHKLAHERIKLKNQEHQKEQEIMLLRENLQKLTHERIKLKDQEYEKDNEIALLQGSVQTLTEDNTKLKEQVTLLQQRTKYRRNTRKRRVPVTQRDVNGKHGKR
ncbi:P-loop containing nucleoside triphosphate hydrolase protein [Nadsonia fulvescens var. elongata DSM 6958]|uniref:p-loop containing nucleoside triphosphate hydrolase protein n=1 Tax=Nadsonia fulvescens var. elongata DSM 6958 TaxID=857566 RepID=A0A1E3PFD7_9ASCO|nr:P-loop containing nucleoside triphosphate hydrolase protein [Nadsonia fulvescens var. elongata DSM 6958]